jgi:hypothetical protein
MALGAKMVAFCSFAVGDPRETECFDNRKRWNCIVTLVRK